MKKSFGFTLAEILIALGIVGVVAILSIPTMMKNYKNRMYTAQLQKVYAQIAGATDTIMSEEQADNFYETKAGTTANSTNTTGLPYFLNTYFKTAKRNCATGDDKCVSNAASGFYKTITGSSIAGLAATTYCIQTVNGASICGFYNPANTCMSLIVDVNGLEAPNIAGRDIFSMDIHKNGSLSDFASGCADNNFGCGAASCTKGDTTNLYYAACGCLTAVMESGWKMEY